MKTMNAMRSVAALLVLLCGAMVNGSATAQDYPSRTIRFVVPSTTGITSDMLARLLGPKLSQRWNVPVSVSMAFIYQESAFESRARPPALNR